MMTTFSPYSILITDDDQGSRETLRDIMAGEGFRTVLASSGEEAIEIVQDDETIHLALMDMHMQTLTGLETWEMVRQFNAMLPCILVTADATEDLMRQAFHARVFSVVPKPVSKNIVVYTVVRALVRVYGTEWKKPPADDDSENNK